LYEDKLTNCKEWQKDFRDRLAHCTAVEGDKFTLQNKLGKAQELLSCREEGYGKVQQVVDQAHLVLPNTSAPGKESINEELCALRQNWDELTARLNTGKTQLEMATSQWTLYEESCASLSKWLTEAENTVKQEAGQQASLPEKRAQLDKAKVCWTDIRYQISYCVNLQVLSLNVNSQKPAIAALVERAETLSQTTQDPRMASDASQFLARYQALADSVKDSTKQMEAQVAEHQGFHDACQDAREWLNLAHDKLVACSDVRGDRQTLETKREKVEELLSMKPEGQAKLRTASERAEIVLPSTSPRGQEAVKSEFKSLSEDFETWNSSVTDTSSQLGRLF
jgi:nesprin-1